MCLEGNLEHEGHPDLGAIHHLECEMKPADIVWMMLLTTLYLEGLVRMTMA